MRIWALVWAGSPDPPQAPVGGPALLVVCGLICVELLFALRSLLSELRRQRMALSGCAWVSVVVTRRV